MAISRKKFWSVVGLLTAAALMVTLLWMAVFSRRSEDPQINNLERTVAMSDIMEAVFRHQLSHHEALQGVEVVFLGLDTLEGSLDPGEGFMKRFAGSKPPVKPASACGFDEEHDDHVIDKETGKAGVILSICPYETLWKSSREVGVLGGYHFAGAAAACYIYTVKRKHGKWVVVGAKLQWVS